MKWDCAGGLEGLYWAWRVGRCGAETEVDVRTLRLCPSRRMAQEEGGSLCEAWARVGSLHRITDLAHTLHFYERWAPDYDQVNPPGVLYLPCPPSLSFPVCTAGIDSRASQGGL